MSIERRRHARYPLSAPEVGVVLCPGTRNTRPDRGVRVFVDVCNMGRGGLQVASCRELDSKKMEVLVRDVEDKIWKCFQVRLAWRDGQDDNGMARLGLEFVPGPDGRTARIPKPAWALTVDPSDIRFLLAAPLLDSIPRQAACLLLNCMVRRNLGTGAPLMGQGEPGQCLFLIQEGECVVTVDKDGQRHQVARLRKGDVVGEMAVLTGEPRTATVHAETPMVLWELGRAEFDRVAEQNPDLRMFLTELVARRFETSPVLADRVIGKYLVKQMLGKGGWGIVYRGVHTYLNKSVAVKMLKHDMAMEDAFLATFRKEAKIIAGLHHRNIVQVYDVEELFRTVFIVMEYLEGRSLQETLTHEAPLAPLRSAALLSQVCAGLDYAHQKGIVHRDIKPDNLFVLPGDQVKILDFGLACAPGLEDMSLAGTVYYAPPEQIEGEPVDARSDIYSLGITAYEMVTGRRPFPENDLNRLLDLHCEQEIPDPREQVPDLPAELAEFILKACRIDPDERHPTAAAAWNDLERFLAREGTPDFESERRNRMTSLHLFYPDERQRDVNLLLEEFRSKARDLGLRLMGGDSREL